MINTLSFEAVQAATFGPHFRRPLPDSYSFAGLPALVRHTLTGEGPLGLPEDVLGDLPRRYDRVLLLFLDAFGWTQVERFMNKSPLLQRIAREGVVSKLTSQFPSTTTAHMTTLVYAQPVGQHGLYEWLMYEPALDTLIVPLLYCAADDEKPNSLPIDPSQLAPGEPFLQTLKTEGVSSIASLRLENFGTRAAQYSLAAATPLPFRSFGDGLDGLTAALQSAGGPLFAYGYHDAIDAASHRFGPDSPETAAEVEEALRLIDERVAQPLAQTGDGRTLLLIVADHGQITVDPDQTLYVNDHLPELEGMMRRGAGGRLLAPAGSPRDLFLHIEPARLDEAVGLLREHPALEDRAEVWTTRDLADAGLFGATSQRFWDRAGNVVVLPVSGQNLWWRERYRVPEHRGDHGGLTSQEMEIPLLALAL